MNITELKQCDNYVDADMGEYCDDVECDCCGERKNLADGEASLLRDAWICTACRA